MKDLVVALALTLLAQAMISLMAFTPAILAPAAQADVGVAASAIGVFTALIYMTASLAALLGGTYIARYGAVRVSQCCLLLGGAGLALCAIAHPLALAAGALLIGGSYGPITPASSEILVARTPERVRNLVISIRQTGVPVGGAIGGAVVPVLLHAAGWRTATLAIAAASVLCALALQPARNHFDSVGRAAPRASRPSLASQLRMVFAHAELRQLSLASFIYAGIQVSLASFLVVFLTERAEFTLIAAGFALSAAMIGGIVGRVLWGVVADAIGSARAVLGMLGMVMALSAFAMSQVTAAWTLGAVVALCIVFGATAIGWNGVWVAEVARIAPRSEIAFATGASLAFTYFGVVVGPFSFWLMIALTGSYALAFVVMGAVTLAGAVSYFRKFAPPEAQPG